MTESRRGSRIRVFAAAAVLLSFVVGSVVLGWAAYP